MLGGNHVGDSTRQAARLVFVVIALLLFGGGFFLGREPINLQGVRLARVRYAR